MHALFVWYKPGSRSSHAVCVLYTCNIHAYLYFYKITIFSTVVVIQCTHGERHSGAKFIATTSSVETDRVAVVDNTIRRIQKRRIIAFDAHKSLFHFLEDPFLTTISFNNLFKSSHSYKSVDLHALVFIKNKKTWWHFDICISHFFSIVFYTVSVKLDCDEIITSFKIEMKFWLIKLYS